MIKPISASWHVGDERTDIYRLLNLAHIMAGELAQSGAMGWRLSKTSTQEHYVFTEWSNGIVNLGAETFKYSGEPVSHEYYLRPAESLEES